MTTSSSWTIASLAACHCAWLTVQRQGDCGCCYAISPLAMLERVYCMKSGSPIEFSVQYLLHCGQSLGMERRHCQRHSRVYQQRRPGAPRGLSLPGKRGEMSLRRPVASNRDQRFSPDAIQQGAHLQAPDDACLGGPLADIC